MRADTARSVLVILGTRGIGDVVEVCPVVAMIHRRRPDARIGLGCNTANQFGMSATVPHLTDRVQLVTGSAKRARVALRNVVANRKAMTGYDDILFLYKKKVNPVMLWTARSTGARVLHRHDYHYRDPRQSPYSDFPERVFYQIVAARALGLPMERLTEPRLAIPPADRRYAEALFRDKGIERRPIVMINTMRDLGFPGWGIENYVQVANALVDLGATVIFNGGTRIQEKEFHRVAERLGPRVSLFERHTPGQLAAVIERCDLFIGDPSGPDCVATAVGTPTITLLGPGEHDFPAQGREGPVWWPRSPDHEILSKVEWCLVEKGEACQCRHPVRSRHPLKRALKRVHLWKPWKALLKRHGLYRRAPRKKTPPCLAAIRIDEVVRSACRHLGIASRVSSIERGA